MNDAIKRVWADEQGRTAPDYSTEYFRDVYIDHVNEVICRGDWENPEVTFDNWLDTVRAEAWEEAKRASIRAALRPVTNKFGQRGIVYPSNPYRKADQ